MVVVVTVEVEMEVVEMEEEEMVEEMEVEMEVEKGGVGKVEEKEAVMVHKNEVHNRYNLFLVCNGYRWDFFRL